MKKVFFTAKKVYVEKLKFMKHSGCFFNLITRCFLIRSFVCCFVCFGRLCGVCFLFVYFEVFWFCVVFCVSCSCECFDNVCFPLFLLVFGWCFCPTSPNPSCFWCLFVFFILVVFFAFWGGFRFLVFVGVLLELCFCLFILCLFFTSLFVFVSSCLFSWLVLVCFHWLSFSFFVIFVCWSGLGAVLVLCFLACFVLVCFSCLCLRLSVCFQNIVFPVILVFCFGLMLAQGYLLIYVFSSFLFVLFFVSRCSFVVSACCFVLKEKIGFFLLFASCFLIILCFFFGTLLMFVFGTHQKTSCQKL